MRDTGAKQKSDSGLSKIEAKGRWISVDGARAHPHFLAFFSLETHKTFSMEAKQKNKRIKKKKWVVVLKIESIFRRASSCRSQRTFINGILCRAVFCVETNDGQYFRTCDGVRVHSRRFTNLKLLGDDFARSIQLISDRPFDVSAPTMCHTKCTKKKLSRVPWAH